MIPVLIPLLCSSFRRADELAFAMDSRCYKGAKGRTRMKKLKMSWRDPLFIVLFVIQFFIILWLKYNFLPFMILQIYTSLSKLDHNLIVAAHDLGCNDRQAFMKVTLPLSIPGVIAGITLVFLPAVSSFFIPKLLGGGSFVLVGNLIENYFVTIGDWNFGAAISLVMTIIILISMYLTKKLDYDKEAR